MSAVLLDGRSVAAQGREKLAERAEQLASAGCQPCLAVLLAGDDPASRVYVKNKKSDCRQCGIVMRLVERPMETSEADLLADISALNADPSVHGVLFQMPLRHPKHFETVLYAISPAKDVDGFHPVNVGKLCIGEPDFLPGTPAGVMALLEAYNIPVSGRHCVVVGRSNIVGKPMALLMLRASATVTVCHSRTADLARHTRQADILVSAVGSIGLITAGMVKPGAVVVDVAMNRKPDGKLTGDVLPEVAEVAGFLTPVPGGVGPMTRLAMLQNTLRAAESSRTA